MILLTPFSTSKKYKVRVNPWNIVAYRYNELHKSLGGGPSKGVLPFTEVYMEGGEMFKVEELPPEIDKMLEDLEA